MDEEIVLKVSEVGVSFINRHDFEEIFGDSYNYEKLINHEKCTGKWKEYFDKMKADGLLK